MKRAGLLLIGLLFAASANASDGWSSLWRTPDQRGEQLLRQGDAAAAAKTYADPRRKAYAELQAGDYAAASRDFAGFDDGDSHYNQGNALARSGKLEDAIKAYDLALARDPGNADAKHNRDLVEQALQQKQSSGQNDSGDQKSSQKQSSNDQKSGDQDQQRAQGQQADTGDGKGQSSNKDSKADGAAQNQPGTPNDGKNETQKSAQQDAAGQQPSPQNKTASQNATSKVDSSQSPANPYNQPQPAQDRTAGAAAEQKPSGASSQAGLKTAQPAPNEAGDDAAQARADAQAGLHQSPQDAQATRDGNTSSIAAANSDAKPMTEQQLAQEQWLRQIPDDPGGLLRRKFMIEHLMRQQQQSP